MMRAGSRTVPGTPSRPLPRCSRRGVPVLAVIAALLAGTVETENAAANGDTRTLSLIHEHTRETLTVTFKRDGRFDRGGLDQLNHLLRDWREDEATKMDPRLFDVVWEAQRSIGSSEPLRVVSAYRSPKTNGMLRRRSRSVAEFSQHMLGKAMDFYMTDASIDQIRAAGMRLQRGGVGWYPRSGSPFVHLDVGSVRSWPRMTHDQLARLFPDGKTVHLPTDNHPLPRYEEARTEILARGGTVLGITAVAQADEIDDGPGLKGFFAGLFGGASESPAVVSSAPKPRAKPVTVVASADPQDATGARQALAYAAPAATDTLRDAMFRRDGRDAVSAQSLLTEASPAGPAPPLPPRRPSEFAAVSAALMIPLPPARSVKLAVLEAASVTGMVNALATANVDEAAFLPSTVLNAPTATAEPRSQVEALFRATTVLASEPSPRSVPVRVAFVRPRRDAWHEAGLMGPIPEDVPNRFAPGGPEDRLVAPRFSGSSSAAIQTQR